MRVAIFGAGRAGRFLLEQMKVNMRGIVQVEAVLDSFASEKGLLDDVPVYEPNEYLKKNNPDAVFIAAGGQKSIWQMIKLLRVHGIDNIYMLHDIAGKNKYPLFTDGKVLVNRIRKIRFSDEKPTLPYFEIPLVDNCNLNCLGCLFACNSNVAKGFMAKEEVEKDFRRMKELFYDIPWIRILGGEPLLHPDLAKILFIAREVFPDTEIDVCTNGLLVPQISVEVWETFRVNHITMHISGYPPTYKMMDKIEACLVKEGIEYYVLPRNDFYKFYTLKSDNDKIEAHKLCPSTGCRELYKGRLLKCSAIIAFERMNQQFGTCYVTKEDEDYFYIHDKEVNGWDIVNKFDEAVAACSYCNVLKMKSFPWGAGSRNTTLEDYIL